MSVFIVPPAVPLLGIVSKPRRLFPAGCELACAFPPANGFNGAATTIADLSRHGLHATLFTPTKQSAVRLIGEAAMEAVEARGRGNAAIRRALRTFNPQQHYSNVQPYHRQNAG
jgi:hypothetical protein